MAKPVKDLKQSGGFAIDKDKIDEKSNYWAKCKGEPRQMSLEKDLPDYVLSGRLNHHTENMGELTKNKKVVKIFLSSTFSDMHEERNYLLSKIFPKLQKFCQNQYNLDFQVVDMRWGVREEADDDHSGPKICMSELKSCQELSLGPNFVCLLGQRYGSCPTPPEISMEVWNAIDKSLNDEEARKAIKKWYAKDVNMKPPSMILKPLHEIIPADKRKEAKMSKEEKKKAKAELDSMFEGLKKGFEKAVENKLMTEEDAKKYLWSVTEEEVYKGVLFLPKDKVKNEALCFVRNIVNINYQDENAKRFVELKEEDNKVVENSDLADNVERLVEETKSHLGPENFFTFPDVKWGHNAMDEDSLKQYLDEFGKKFEKEVKRLIIQRGFILVYMNLIITKIALWLLYHVQWFMTKHGKCGSL
ncbi:NACHT and WD repeat domain-containing protein 2-like [Watersipora subatra]|uniref:NACHT and WD repeat domain-containing protein 2-like n=1 Tax=Watersipora subatra TaxID=2589382 RepID=UPI00355BDF24